MCPIGHITFIVVVKSACYDCHSTNDDSSPLYRKDAHV